MNPAGTGAARRMLVALWVVLRVTCLSLLAAELFLRLVRPITFREPPDPGFLGRADEMLYRHSATPGLLYEMNPHVRKVITAGSWVATNAQGMRDHELLPRDTAGLSRIAVLGDSFAFGLGVPIDDAFSEVLERGLNQTAGGDGRYEVLNFGVPGYSSQEEAAVLTSKALDWNPAAVIIAYCLNDPETEPLQPIHVFFTPVQWWQHFHLLRLAALFAVTMETNRLGGGNYIKALHAPQSSKWRSVERAFAQMHALTAARQIPTLVVIFPLLESGTWEDYPYRAIHAQVAAAARAHGLEALDLLPLYESYPSSSLWVLPEDHHPSQLGHQLAAAAIQRYAQERGWFGTGHR